MRKILLTAAPAGMMNLPVAGALIWEEAAQIADAFASGQQRMIDEEGPDEGCTAAKETAEFIANAIRRRATNHAVRSLGIPIYPLPRFGAET